jgi:hypothetical protein
VEFMELKDDCIIKKIKRWTIPNLFENIIRYFKGFCIFTPFILRILTLRLL